MSKATVKTLMEIDEDIQALLDILYETGGDVTDEEAEAAIDEWLRENEANLRKKVDGYAGLINTLGATAKLRREEAKRLNDLASTDANAANRLKERLHYFFNHRQIQKMETEYHRLWIQKNGGKAPVELSVDPRHLPEKYQVQVITADNDKIREDLEAGVKIPGARLLERGTHLRIK